MKINDSVGCAGSAALLFLAYIWIPIFGPVLSLLAPVPFLLYSTKYGPLQGAKIVVIAALIVGLVANLSGHPQVIVLCLELGVLGLVMAEAFRREYTFGMTLFIGITFMLMVGFGVLVFYANMKHLGPFEFISNYVQGNLKEAFSVYESMGEGQGKNPEIQEYGKVLTEAIFKIYPSLMVIGTGFVVWINMIVSKTFFKRWNLKYPDFGPLDRWQAPEHIVWGLIGSGFALFFVTGIVKSLAINALIVISAIYFFHGLSIILFFFNKYRIPPLMRLGAYLLIIFQQFFMVGLAIAGLFDQWFDFRKIHKKSTE